MLILISITITSASARPTPRKPSIGGFYPGDGPGKTDNSYHTFNANGEDWIAFALEWGPRDAVVQWADQVLSSPAYTNHNAILVTHAYMYNDDTIYDWATKGSSQSWNPHSYGIQNLPGGVNDGQELWDEFVKKHDNFKFVFNGHVLGDGTGKRRHARRQWQRRAPNLGQLSDQCRGRPGRYAIAGVQGRWRDGRRANLFARA